jgi:hypothetical protein
MANTVKIKSYTNIYDERIANGTITPGMLVARLSTGKVAAHAVAAGPNGRLFAIEDENQGRAITDNYVVNELVKLWRATPGEQVQAISSGAIAVGDFVESDGAGKLRTATIAATTLEGSTVGIALTATTGADQAVVVEII